MKISKTLRDIYEENLNRYKDLPSEVKAVFQADLELAGWFYMHRLKKLESFALKVETGRVSDPRNMEDYFGCTIIVPTLEHIIEAEELVARHYDVDERRPANNEITSKAASDFRFDDVRLYVSRRPSLSGRNSHLEGLKFEIQIKTALQHAWSVATHGLIYKSDRISWPMERIAYQVKAMLEHAEIAISEAESLSSADGVNKDNKQNASIKTTILCIRKYWNEDLLPSDIKRLATSVAELFYAVRVSVEKLDGIISTEKTRVGIIPTNISPYSFIVQALLFAPDLEFRKNFLRQQRCKILIQEDMEVPEWLKGLPGVIDLRPAAPVPALITPSLEIPRASDPGLLTP